MDIFADLAAQVKPTGEQPPTSVEQALEIQQPKLPADPQGIGPDLFSDLVNPQERVQQQSWLDKRLEIFGRSMTAVKQGGMLAGEAVLDNLLGVEQWVGEAAQKIGKVGRTNEAMGAKALEKWGKNLAESSESLGREVDIWRQEHPEEAMQISPDAGFWEATKQVITSPANMTKGLIQALPMMAEAYLGGEVVKFAGLAPRTLATVQRWGRIAGIGAGEFGSNYRDARKKNVSPEAATAQAFLTSLGDAIVEEWTLSKKIGIFKSAKAALLKNQMSKLASTILIGGTKAYVRGAGEEAVQQLNSNFWNFVFTDRSQELMKGVSQAAAIGGPLEMVMAGAFAGAGIATRGMNKVQQLQRLDKFDDFIEQTDMKDSEKAEAHQVIENKRTEISQTSILPMEETVDEQPIEQLTVYHGTNQSFEKIQSINQLQKEGKGVESANIGSQSKLVFLSENPNIALQYGKMRTKEIPTGKPARTISFNLQGKVLDISKSSSQYTTEEQKLLVQIGQALIDRSDNRGGDAFLGSELKRLSTHKGEEKSPMPLWKNIEQSKYIDEVLREFGYTALRFTDKDIGGRIVQSIAAIPESLQSKTQTPQGEVATGQPGEKTIAEKRELIRQFNRDMTAWLEAGREGPKPVMPIDALNLKKPTFDNIQPENIPEIPAEQLHQEVNAANDVNTTLDKIIELAKQADYITQTAGITEAKKAELAKRWGGVKELMDAGVSWEQMSAELKGELPSIQYASMMGEFNPEQIKGLINHIRFDAPRLTKTSQKFDAERGLMRLLNGDEVRPAELKLFMEAFGPKGKELVEALGFRHKRTVGHIISDIYSLPIALLTSMEMSGLLRQGFFLAILNPKAGLSDFKVSAEILFSKIGQWENVSDRIDTEIKTSPNYDFLKDTCGVEFADYQSVSTAGVTETEEMYRSNLANRIPGIGRSAATMALGLNKLRLDFGTSILNEWKGTIKTETDYKMLGQLINLSTGRGDITTLKKFLPMLTGAFFAPKLFMSRFQLPIHFFRTMVKSPAVFKIMANQLIRFAAIGGAAIALLSMVPGVHVEKDPESSDFLKIRYGNTRVSFFQGYEQIIRTIVQEATGYRKSTVTGRRMKTDRADIILSFLHSKVSPVTSAVWENLEGKNFDGSPVEYTTMGIAKSFYQKATPMFWQDMVDAIRFEGLDGLLITAPAGFVGLTTQTYPIRPEQQAVLVKEDLSKRVFGKSWDDIGPIAQKLLREHNPQIEESEAIANQQRDGYPYLDEIIKEQMVSKKKIYRSLPDNVQDELDMSFADIGGLSRRVANGWYLNDKNYATYNSDVSKYLNVVLPKLVATPGYKLLTTDQKKVVLEEFISRIKSAVRKKLIDGAKREDIQSLKERMKK